MKTKKSQNWPLVRWLIKAQITLTLAVAVLVALLFDGNDGWYVILGGLAATLLTTIAALRAFAVSADDDPKGALLALYRGLAAKIIGTVVFFLVIARLVPQQLPFALIGFVAATTSYWIALLWAPMPGAPTRKTKEREDTKLDG